MDLAEELGFWNPRTVLRLAASDEGGDEGVEVFGADGVVGVAGSDEGVAGDVGDGGVVGRWQRKRYKIGGGVDHTVRLPRLKVCIGTRDLISRVCVLLRNGFCGSHRFAQQRCAGAADRYPSRQAARG